MKKIKPGNTKGCCENCWNSKFALGSRVKDGICGLSCECHLKMGKYLEKDEQILQITGFTCSEHGEVKPIPVCPRCV